MRRKESSHSRLFKAIKESFNSKEKIRKKIKLKTNLFFEENSNSLHRKRSEQLLGINNKLDESNYSKDNISFNSNCAQYNMNLSIFQGLKKNAEKNCNLKKNSIDKINIKKKLHHAIFNAII